MASYALRLHHDRWALQPEAWNMHPILLTLFIGAMLLRLGSIAVSRRNEKTLKTRGAIEYGRRNSHLLAMAHALFYGGALVEGLWRSTQPTRWTTVGLLLYGISIIALVLVWQELNRFWTVKLIIASDHLLNQSALFRWVRHPNYFLNIIPELVGLALIMGAWIVLVVGLPLYLIVLRERIVQEELVMKEHFPHYSTHPFPPPDQDTNTGHPSS
jgi:isoprenylcysteine carboxyl methyltransferase (ICMT) family protein YpbQ